MNHEQTSDNFLWCIEVDAIPLVDKLVVSSVLGGFLVVPNEMFVLGGCRVPAALGHGVQCVKIITRLNNLEADCYWITDNEVIMAQ